MLPGRGAAASLTLAFLGGDLEGQSMRVEGMPRFTEGQREILFISGNGTRFCPPVAMMHGRYHVLQGHLDPIRGIGGEQLRVSELNKRIDDESITEVIVCTNPNIEGEATALYVAKEVRERHPSVNVTRIASGLPVGGDLEYADELTLGRALEGRTTL